MTVGPINAGEENATFLHQIGRALTQWAYVEHHLVRIVSRCLGGTYAKSEAVASAYLSIENFRSKLRFVDSTIVRTQDDASVIARWKVLHDRLGRLASKRNAVAHNLRVLYVDRQPGERYALVPWLDNELNAASTTPTVRGKAKKALPPPGSLHLRDIAQIAEEFYALTISLANFYELVTAHRTPLTELALPIARPSLGSIRNQIRAKLSLPLVPSRKSPRKEK